MITVLLLNTVGGVARFPEPVQTQGQYS